MDEKVQAFGQVFIAALLLLAWSGLSAVSLDVHHQSTYGKVQKITSHDKTVDSICLKMPPRQVFPGGTGPIMPTYGFVAICQAHSIFALEKSTRLCGKKIRQLWTYLPTYYKIMPWFHLALAREKKPHSSDDRWKAEKGIWAEECSWSFKGSKKNHKLSALLLVISTKLAWNLRQVTWIPTPSVNCVHKSKEIVSFPHRAIRIADTLSKHLDFTCPFVP